MKKKPKPCRFCRMASMMESNKLTGWHWVVCGNRNRGGMCAMGPVRKSKHAAIRAWDLMMGVK
jgi:hypothetical protein